jgi:hypothetical protein
MILSRIFFSSLPVLLLGLPAAAAASGDSPWHKELNLSAGFSHSRSKIKWDGYFYERGKVAMELKARCELDRNAAASKWANTLKLDYSSSWAKDETDPYDKPKWVEDKDQLTLDTVYTLHTGFFANPYGAANLQTSVHDSGSDTDFRAFRPVQVRESAGLILTFLDTASQEFSLRGGLFRQDYLNRRLYHHAPFHGAEAVLEYDGNLGPAVILQSKAGLYTGFVATDDSWNRLTQSRKSALEWDNTLTVSLSKLIKLIISFDLDNKDVSSTEIDYEWEQSTSLALSWKIF